jgi:hypothetical protein
MLTLLAGQAESLWDEALPVEVRELPDDLVGLDRLLSDPELLRRSWSVGDVSWWRRAGRPAKPEELSSARDGA